MFGQSLYTLGNPTYLRQKVFLPRYFSDNSLHENDGYEYILEYALFDKLYKEIYLKYLLQVPLLVPHDK